MNYYYFIRHCGAFCRLKWTISQAKMYFSPLNKPMKSENQTVIQYKQPIKIEKPLECLCRFLAALVKEMMVPFSCPNHGWKHSKQWRKSKFSVFSTRGKRSSKGRGWFHASKHQKTAHSSSMASACKFCGFKPNALRSPIMPNCQFSNCTINFNNTYKYALSNFPFMSSIISENSNGKIS